MAVRQMARRKVGMRFEEMSFLRSKEDLFREIRNGMSIILQDKNIKCKASCIFKSSMDLLLFLEIHGSSS